MESRRIGKSELEDEILFDGEVIQLIKWILVCFAGLALLTTACIWMKDFRSDSTFSTITGRMESSK